MTWGNQNTDEEAAAQLNLAWELGVNFLDTAEIYPVPVEQEKQGATDRAIAKWLKTSKQPRDKVIIASKVAGYNERFTWMRDGPTRVTREQIHASVDASLDRLGVDHLDLLQIHWPDRYVPLFGSGTYDASQEREAVPFVEQLQALKKLVDQGKVRHIGVSNETPYGVCRFIQEHERDASLPRICSIQNSYSLLVRSDFESGLTETCAQTNVGLLAYSPLAGGILSGKYSGSKAPAGARLNLFPGFMDRYAQSLAREAVAEYERVAAAYDVTPAQLALKWCYSRPHVASTIIGATSMDQLRENIDAFFLDDLPEGCLDAVADVYSRYRDPSKTS